MAKQASDREMLTTDTSTRNMQDRTVHGRVNANDGHLPAQRSPLAASTAAESKSPSHASQDISNRRNVPKARTKDSDLVRRAAIQRENARGNHLSHAQSPDPSQPVLVRPAPLPADMRKKREPTPTNSSSSQLPSPNDFSFDEILTSIGPEAHDAINAIAEICGRSKLSLADEHGSHRPPQGEVEALPIARTEALGPSTRDGPQTRSMARRLTVSRNGDAISGNATAATSTVTSHMCVPKKAGSRSRTDSHTALVPQIIAWLRGSEDMERPAGDVGAANSLHRLLDEAESART